MTQEDSPAIKQIASSELKLKEVPPQGASWREISLFAITFEGYTWAGTTSALAGLSGKVKAQFAQTHEISTFTLDELRATLFWEQRCIRWGQEPPSLGQLEFARDLVDAIRKKIRVRDS